MDTNYVCRVCGFVHDVPIRNDFGEALLYEYCICCGVAWGEEDETLEDIRRYRAEWLARGAEWAWPAVKPDNWEVEQQLTNIPKFYR